jgi:hypothetical protein
MGPKWARKGPVATACLWFSLCQKRFFCNVDCLLLKTLCLNTQNKTIGAGTMENVMFLEPPGVGIMEHVFLEPPGAGVKENVMFLMPPSAGKMEDVLFWEPPAAGIMEYVMFLEPPGAGIMENVLFLYPPGAGLMENVMFFCSQLQKKNLQHLYNRQVAIGALWYSSRKPFVHEF